MGRRRLLTPEQVRELRIRYAALPMSKPERPCLCSKNNQIYMRPNKGVRKKGVSALAKEFGILQPNIYAIIKGHTYSDIT